MDFINNEKLWLKTFAKAWHVATENGFDLTNLDQVAFEAIQNKEEERESIHCTHLTEEECHSLDEGIVYRGYPPNFVAELKAGSKIKADGDIDKNEALLHYKATTEVIGSIIHGGEAKLFPTGWSEAWGTLIKLGQSTLNASATVQGQGTVTRFGEAGMNAVATVKPIATGGTPSTSNSRLNAISTISAVGTGGTESTP